MKFRKAQFKKLLWGIPLAILLLAGGVSYAARDFDGVNDQISWGSLSQITNLSTISFSCWIYSTNVTADHAVFNFTNDRMNLYQDDVGSASGRTDMFKIHIRESSTISFAEIEGTTNSAKVNQWQHVFISFTPNVAGGLQLWVDGVEDAQSPVTTSAVDDIGWSGDTMYFGEDPRSSRDRNGKMAECAWWNRVLTDSEIIALSKGFAPSFFRNGMVFYSTIIGNNSPEIDMREGASGTLTGTTNAIHPRIMY